MSARDIPPASSTPPESPARMADLARWYASTWTAEGGRWRRVLGSLAFAAALIVTWIMDERGAWTASLTSHPLGALGLAACLAAWAWLELVPGVQAENRTRKALLALRVLMWLGIMVFAGPPRSAVSGWVLQAWAGAFVVDAALSFRRTRDWVFTAGAFVAIAALLLWWSV